MTKNRPAQRPATPPAQTRQQANNPLSDTPAQTPPPPADTAPATGPAPAPAAATPRKRQALSMEKQLAIVVSSLIGILNREPVAATLTDDEKATVTKANDFAGNLNAKTIEPVKARIAEIQEAFAKLQTQFTEPGANIGALADKAKDLAAELGRKQKQLEALTKLAAAA